MEKNNKNVNNTLTPKETVKQLDRFIIGQAEAKKAVAIALRNRYRRRQLEKPMRDEIVPKNILMIGPTGVGKTEIARRLALLSNAPFLKVEATKFTEVGYVGKDVDSIIRDLADIAVKQYKKRAKAEKEEIAYKSAKAKVVDILVGKDASDETKERFSLMIDAGTMKDNEIEIEVIDNPMPASTGFDIPGAHIGMISIGDIFGKGLGLEKRKKKKMTIGEAIEVLKDEESDKLIDEEKAVSDALKQLEQEAIVFIDEIDKVSSRGDGNGKNGNVSREGVQRDLLPLVEGTTVNTKYGLVKTDHILFIASGAFHSTNVSDLLPELQGRFPIRVKLNPLTEPDLVKILKEPENSLVKQYKALLETEGIKVEFAESGIKEIAKLAFKVNNEVENIGARRLHTLMEKILEELSFEASDIKFGTEIVIDKKYVQDHIGDLTQNIDLAKFIL